MLYSTTANLICIDFYVYFPKTAQSTADTVQCAAVFEVFPINTLCLLPCDVTYTANPLVSSRMGPWQKREGLCPQIKLLITKSDSSNLTRDFTKVPNNVFSCKHHQKRPKNAKLWRTCQTPFFHAKPLLKKPKFWNLTLKCQPGNPGNKYRNRLDMSKIGETPFKLTNLQPALGKLADKHHRKVRISWNELFFGN